MPSTHLSTRTDSRKSSASRPADSGRSSVSTWVESQSEHGGSSASKASRQTSRSAAHRSHVLGRSSHHNSSSRSHAPDLSGLENSMDALALTRPSGGGREVSTKSRSSSHGSRSLDRPHHGGARKSGLPDFPGLPTIEEDIRDLVASGGHATVEISQVNMEFGKPSSGSHSRSSGPPASRSSRPSGSSSNHASHPSRSSASHASRSSHLQVPETHVSSSSHRSHGGSHHGGSHASSHAPSRHSTSHSSRELTSSSHRSSSSGIEVVAVPVPVAVPIAVPGPFYGYRSCGHPFCSGHSPYDPFPLCSP
jgi:hypothetical protein